MNDIDELKKILLPKIQIISEKIEAIYHSEEKSIIYIKSIDGYYYSSSHNKTNILDKKYIWCSHVFSQAFLHIFDQIRTSKLDIEPIIYRFRLQSKINLLKSYDKNHILVAPYIQYKNFEDVYMANKMKRKQSFNDINN